MLNWRLVAIVGAVAMAALEVIDAPAIDAPFVALIFAVLFLLGAWLVRRGGLSGLVLLIVLSLIELPFLPTYERNNAFDWAVQIGVAIAAVVCLAGSIAAVVTGHRSGSGTT